MNVLRSLGKSFAALPRKLRGLYWMLFDEELSRTYYPDEPRKSRLTIFRELVAWLLWHHEVNRFYYVYGMDRKGVRARDFIGRIEFQRLRDRGQAARALGDGQIQYISLVADKFLFGMYLESLGFPTPRVRAVGGPEQLYWVDQRAWRPFASIAERDDLDGFLKDQFGLMGRGVFSVRKRDGEFLVNGKAGSPESLAQGLPERVILQDRMTQHPRMAELYPHSVNTVRLVTYWNGAETSLFGGFVRAGTGVEHTDNWGQGGVLGGFDAATGRLHPVFKYKPGSGGCVDRHPDTGVVFGDFTIPLYDQIVRATLDLHRLFYGLQTIGWDVAVGPDGPIFIEANEKWSIEGFQTPHGPLREALKPVLCPPQSGPAGPKTW